MSEAEDHPEPGGTAPDTSPDGPPEDIASKDVTAEDIAPEDVAADRDAWASSALPGQPLTTLLFRCDEHGEEQVVDYFDPLSPPRCSHGDRMVRAAG
ncbi:hypothetical protein [Streptomyces sp. NPDC050534]|uniref:hypothetical protein n=1 Tax=Streptomyces sp. NPDC050534 TaxID=3365625 RepID=UPI00378D1E8F